MLRLAMPTALPLPSVHPADLELSNPGLRRISLLITPVTNLLPERFEPTISTANLGTHYPSFWTPVFAGRVDNPGVLQVENYEVIINTAINTGA